jgi:CRP/FNR family transcriptional regulator, cyclic AMP receptor protein
MVKTELSERFLSAPMLADVEPGARRAVLEFLVEERADKGTILLEQGQRNDHMSFLIAGSATIERARPGSGKTGGRMEALATLTAPSMFGTTSFYHSDPPRFTVRAASDVALLTLYHPAHERLRQENPQAAEALAVAVVHVLTERLNELDAVFSKYMAEHPDDEHKVTEWAGFRARLFQDPND